MSKICTQNTRERRSLLDIQNMYGFSSKNDQIKKVYYILCKTETVENKTNKTSISIGNNYLT